MLGFFSLFLIVISYLHGKQETKAKRCAVEVPMTVLSSHVVSEVMVDLSHLPVWGCFAPFPRCCWHSARHFLIDCWAWLSACDWSARGSFVSPEWGSQRYWPPTGRTGQQRWSWQVDLTAPRRRGPGRVRGLRFHYSGHSPWGFLAGLRHREREIQHFVKCIRWRHMGPHTHTVHWAWPWRCSSRLSWGLMRHTPVPCPTFWPSKRRCCCDWTPVSSPQNPLVMSWLDGHGLAMDPSAARRSNTRSAWEGRGGPSHLNGSWTGVSHSPAASHLPRAIRQF